MKLQWGGREVNIIQNNEHSAYILTLAQSCHFSQIQNETPSIALPNALHLLKMGLLGIWQYPVCLKVLRPVIITFAAAAQILPKIAILPSL